MSRGRLTLDGDCHKSLYHFLIRIIIILSNIILESNRRHVIWLMDFFGGNAFCFNRSANWCYTLERTCDWIWIAYHGDSMASKFDYLVFYYPIEKNCGLGTIRSNGSNSYRCWTKLEGNYFIGYSLATKSHSSGQGLKFRCLHSSKSNFN